MSDIRTHRRSIIVVLGAIASAACDSGLGAAVREPVTASPVALRPREDAGGPVASEAPELAEAWFLAGSLPGDYELAKQPDAGGLGRIRVLRHRDGAVQTGFGTLMQTFLAHKYRGRRVRFSARVRSVDVATSASLWMRVDGDRTPSGAPEQLAKDNMWRRPIRGTTDWTPYAVVLDVAPQAQAVALGILLSGGGSVWLAEPRFEIVGADVAETTDRTPLPTGFAE